VELPDWSQKTNASYEVEIESRCTALMIIESLLFLISGISSVCFCAIIVNIVELYKLFKLAYMIMCN